MKSVLEVVLILLHPDQYHSALIPTVLFQTVKEEVGVEELE